MHPDDVDPYDAHELDPDWDAVPREVRRRIGQQVMTTAPDDTPETAAWTVSPGVFAHARRLQDGETP